MININSTNQLRTVFESNILQPLLKIYLYLRFIFVLINHPLTIGVMLLI